MNETAQKWYESEYSRDAAKAQRRWPNEELARFMGRSYGMMPYKSRKNISVLEVGCGSGANIRLLIEEGYYAYGLDFSKSAIDYCRSVYPDATYSVDDMTKLPYEDNKFDCIVDIFSSNCLDENMFTIFLNEVHRVLKKGGRFFSYTPSKASDAWKNHLPAKKTDDSTLNGIYRETSPFYGNLYTFRFMGENDVRKYCEAGFELEYFEKVGRTYRDMQEYFEFLTYSLVKL